MKKIFIIMFACLQVLTAFSQKKEPGNNIGKSLTIIKQNFPELRYVITDERGIQYEDGYPKDGIAVFFLFKENKVIEECMVVQSNDAFPRKWFDSMSESFFQKNQAGFITSNYDTKHLCFSTFQVHLIYKSENGINTALLIYENGGYDTGITGNDFNKINESYTSKVNYYLTSLKLNEKLYIYDKKLKTYSDRMNVLYKQYNEIVDDTSAAGKAKLKELEAQCEQLQDSMINKQMDIVRANTDNLIPAYYLAQLYFVLDYNELKALLPETAPYYNHPAMAPVKAQLAALEKRKPGLMYTDLSMNDTEGQPRKLSDWCGKGNYVLVDFWASWCGPCRQEMPNVVANYAKYHGKGFEVVGVSFDNNAEAWKKAIKDIGMTWPNISDLKGWKSAAVTVYGIKAIPANILLDGEGKIVATDLRGGALGEKLKEVYGF